MEHLIVALIVLFWFVLGWRANTWMSERIDIQRGRDADDPSYKYCYFAVRIRGRWRRICVTYSTGRPVK